jgi:prepilin-type N-terminal cleavage/methylation domain-containing protein
MGISLPNKKYSESGFTLVELLIVIMIIGVLATISIVFLNPQEYVRRANDSKRIADLKALNQAIQMDVIEEKIKITNAVNTETSGSTATGSTGGGWVRFVAGDAITGTTADKLSGFPSLPVDPNQAAGWRYGFCSDTGGRWVLWTALESTINSEIEKSDGNNNNFYEVGPGVGSTTCTPTGKSS